MSVDHPRSSRQRYRVFVEDYKHRRLDDATEADGRRLTPGDGARSGGGAAVRAPARPWRGKQRQYVRDYLRWLRPHRGKVVVVFLLALVVAGLQMVEPLFMRFIVDRVLLNRALDLARQNRRPSSTPPWTCVRGR